MEAKARASRQIVEQWLIISHETKPRQNPMFVRINSQSAILKNVQTHCTEIKNIIYNNK